MSDNELDLEAFEKLDLTVDSAKARKARTDALRIASISPKEIFDKIQKAYDEVHEKSSLSDGPPRVYLFLEGEIDLQCPEFLALREVLMKHEVIEDVELDEGTHGNQTTMRIHLKDLRPKPPVQIEQEPAPKALPAPPKKRRWWDYGRTVDAEPEKLDRTVIDNAAQASAEGTASERRQEMARQFYQAVRSIEKSAEDIHGLNIDRNALSETIGKTVDALRDESVSLNIRPLGKARLLVSDLAETFARHAKMDNLDKQALNELDTCFRQVTRQIGVLTEQAAMPEQIKAEVERRVLINMSVN